MKRIISLLLIVVCLTGCYGLFPFIDNFDDYQEHSTFNLDKTLWELTTSQQEIDAIITSFGYQEPKFSQRNIGFTVRVSDNEYIDFFLEEGFNRSFTIECYFDFKKGEIPAALDVDFICTVLNAVAQQAFTPREIEEFIKDPLSEYSAGKKRIRELNDYYGRIIDYKLKDTYNLDGKRFELLVLPGKSEPGSLYITTKIMANEAFDLSLFKAVQAAINKKYGEALGFDLTSEKMVILNESSHLFYSYTYSEYENAQSVELHHRLTEESVKGQDFDYALFVAIVNHSKKRQFTVQSLREFVEYEAQKPSLEHSIGSPYVDDYEEGHLEYRVYQAEEKLTYLVYLDN